MTTQQQPLREGKRSAPRLVVFAGLAAAVIGTVGLLLILFFTTFAAQPAEQSGIWEWFKATTGLDESAAAAVIVGGSLAGCLVGFVLGVIGWVVARRRGASIVASRLTVLVSLIGPIAVLVTFFVGYCVLVSSGQGPS